MLNRHPEAVLELEKAVRLAEDAGCENKLTYVVNLGKAKIRQVANHVSIPLLLPQVNR